MNNNQRKMSVLLGIIVVICVICSLVYINEEAHHDCTGQGCSVCMQIHAAQDLLNSIKDAVMIGIFFLVLYVSRIQVLYSMGMMRRQRSPITLKVKLLN